MNSPITNITLYYIFPHLHEPIKIINFTYNYLNYMVMDNSLLARISLDPEICHGKPVIRNTRHMVDGILEYLAGGDTIEDILKEYPELSREDILACIAYAAKAMQLKDISIPAA